MKVFLIPCLAAVCSWGSLYAAEDGAGIDLFGPATPSTEHDQKPGSDLSEADKKAKQLEALFTKLDSDGNGSISNQEFSALHEATRSLAEERHEAHKQEMLTKYDANGDGELDKEERHAFMKDRQQVAAQKHLEHLKEKDPERYASMDSNGDGTVDQEEMAAVKDKMLERLNEKAKSNPELLKKFDTNGDGSIDQQELNQMRNKKRQGKKDKERPAKNKDSRKRKKEK